MQFVVPKFLEREATIAFGLTFKKLAALGGIGLVLFALYYAVPRLIFVSAAFVLAIGFLAAVFVKIDGVSITEIVRHSFRFLLSSKVFIWSKKEAEAPIRFVHKKEVKTASKDTSLQIIPQSHLGAISSKIETGQRRV